MKQFTCIFTCITSYQCYLCGGKSYENILAIACVAFLSACASGVSYIPPTEQAPVNWQVNDLDLKNEYVVGSVKSFSGVMEKGDAFLSYDRAPNRTAVLEDDFSFTLKSGETIVIPVNTKAYARQFVRGKQSYRDKLNPIEWCVPYLDQVHCIFWATPKTTWVGTTSAVGIHPLVAPPYSSAAAQKFGGAIAPMPKLKEQAVKFKVPVEYQIQVAGVKEKGLEIRHYIYSPMSKKSLLLSWSAPFR